MLSNIELKELLNYDETTGIFTWKVRSSRQIRIGDVAGSVSKKDGYTRIFVKRKSYLAHRLAWQYIIGNVPSDEIDHIDWCRSNNKIENIRHVTKSENLQNLKHAKCDNLSSGFLGVCFDKKAGKYRSAITLNKKRKHLGYFETAELAHDAYLIEKRIIHSGCTL
jgi:hypothetical protein